MTRIAELVSRDSTDKHREWRAEEGWNGVAGTGRGRGRGELDVDDGGAE